MYEINLNGTPYYVDFQSKILYLDREKTSGTPFNYLNKDMLDEVMNQIRFPKSRK